MKMAVVKKDEEKTRMSDVVWGSIAQVVFDCRDCRGGIN